MYLRRYLLYIMMAATLPLFAQKNAAAKNVEKPFTVVIDAGHGGHDSGALGRLTQEKKLNLDVSLLLGKMIEGGMPDVKVYYTRKTDVFLTLQERANFVNKHGADLFICIHTNASDSKDAVGAETFVLGIDKMASNLAVAMRENAVMLLEDNYETTYQGFDPNSVDSYIMFELMQDQYFDQSLQFATQVQQQFSGSLKRADRGVRQAGFWVLHKSACPSVLVEMGFISNPEEERFLASQEGKEAVATALYNAFVTHKNALDKKNGKLPQAEQKQVKEPARSDSLEGRTSAEAPQLDATTSATPAEEQGRSSVERSKKPEYRIQIFAVSQKLKPNDPTFRGLKNCSYTRDGKFYKYTYGNETDYDAAVRLHKKVKEKFPDSFIVAFLDGKQILVKDARKM